MVIRDLTTLEECRQVAALEKDVWGYRDAEDVVPPPVLIVSIKRGGVLLGAFDDGGLMKGFVYSLPAVKDGRLTQWSHMLGVARDARGAGLGLRLKLAQRDRSLAMGVDLVEWTYDPLQALNAHLNFARLGTVVEEYEENIYGDSSSVLHRGSPTDRFVAAWAIRSPHVERRIQSRGAGLVRDASVGTAPLVNPSVQRGARLTPGPANLTIEAARLLVEIPVGFPDLQAQDPASALAWRFATREIFQHYFGRGYRAVDFFLSRDSARGHYLLARRTPRTSRERKWRMPNAECAGFFVIGHWPLAIGHSGLLKQPSQLAQRLDDRHVGRGADRQLGPRDEDPAHAEAQGAFDVVRDAVPHHHGLARRDAGAAQPLREDGGMRLHEAVIGRGDGDREQAVEREVLLERLERALRVRDEADREAVGVQRAQHLGHLFIEREVVTGRPRLVQVAGGGIGAGAAAAHALDDAPRVVDEDLRIVGASLRVEGRRGRRHRGVEPRGVGGEAMPRARLRVPVPLERRPRVNQREVHVEEDRSRHF
jgi:chorismate synthase